MPPRLDALRHAAAEAGADALLVSFLPDVRWACGFTGSNGLLLVREAEAHFVTDGRYDAQARAEVRGATVHVPGYDLVGLLVREGLVPGGMRVAVQAEHTTLAAMAELSERLPGARWVATEGLVAPLVAAKAPDEVARIEAALRVSEAVYDEVCGLLRPGLSERAVAAEIVYRHLARGCERVSFDPIVASGPNGALPHARPSDRVLAAGELVVLDFGGVVDGYASDLTRTVALGEPGEAARRMHALVGAAQDAAFAAARPGLPARDLDAAARGVIEAAGFGPQFAHGLGHGIGLQTHEWPKVSASSDAVLPSGACVTLEPGVYLGGRFGVRTEDIVQVVDGRARRLTRADRALRVL